MLYSTATLQLVLEVVPYKHVGPTVRAGPQSEETINKSTMNEEKKQVSERVANTLLRVLAVIGFVAVLALLAWVLVRAIGYFPTAQNNLTGAVSGLWKKGPETLEFSIPVRTLPVDEPTQVEWVYEGEMLDTEFSFSYACEGAVTLERSDNGVWTTLPCESPFVTKENGIIITPKNDTARFSEVRLTVEGAELSDTITLSIVNTDVPLSDDETTATDTSATGETVAPTTPSAPKTTQNVTNKKVVPQYSGPADLDVEILKTGVLIEVEDENTFFPVSPIPADKVAGVVFVVTNKGGVTSDVWKFTAELPIEGDESYKYTSPLQIPLASGMQIEFTLGFDEVLRDSEGEITITLKPGDDNDASKNNTDSVTIDIKR